MAKNPNAAFDIGPLSWVKSEIEHSLTETRTHLETLAGNPGDAKAFKYAASHLHQVTGALTMVGLGAATRFNEEVEKLVGSLESDPDARAQAPQRISTALKAAASLSAYLDSLMAGEPDRPMLLARAYLEVNKARGASTASEVDLFSPDLSLATVMPDHTVALPKPEMLAEAIKQRRAMYQMGLLKLLRDKDMIGGAREMRNATLAIEALQVTSPTVSFWYAASGFFDAVASDPAEAGILAVQLFGKIDQQIKLLVEGVQKIPEKLFRDILLVIGKSKANTERLRKIRKLYRLDELLAVPVVLGSLGSDDELKAVIRSMRDQVQEQKENWLKYATGNRAALEQFVAQSEPFYALAQQQPNKELTQLVQHVGGVGAHLRKAQLPATEVQSLEMATALLFLESSLENYFRQSSDFSAQANNLVARLKGAITGAVLPPPMAGTAALMDDMSRRAQERMLIFQVGQEVLVNLATIEGALDGYFRDPSKPTELSGLGPLFSQIQGALTMLELDEAAALNQLLTARVGKFASAAITSVGEDVGCRRGRLRTRIVCRGIAARLVATARGATACTHKVRPRRTHGGAGAELDQDSRIQCGHRCRQAKSAGTLRRLEAAARTNRVAGAVARCGQSVEERRDADCRQRIGQTKRCDVEGARRDLRPEQNRRGRSTCRNRAG